jgi:acyl-coenzyme A thioesterase PaaI-like protein
MASTPSSPAFDRLRQTFGMRLFGWLKIPLLASVRPSVVELGETRCVVRIPLRRWTRNHLGSMYFGALAIGADCAGGLLAMDQIKRLGGGVSLVFKAFQATFHKRPESDVYFICEDGAAIRGQVQRALASEERITEPMRIEAAVKAADGTFEPVASFVLELSLKRKG